MTLGTSIDHGWCSATSKHCLVVINTVKESYCADHRLELYHSARIKRQEFAGGLNQVQQGAPTDKTKKKHINRGIKCMVHYNINSLVLAAEGLDCQLREKPKPTSQQCTTQEM